MIHRNRSRCEHSAGRRHGRPTIGSALWLLAALLLASPAAARVLDFGAALQSWTTGTPVYQVVLIGGGFMTVAAKDHGDGPDFCLVFDSSHPTHGQEDLGTPNEDFGGPGEGSGGELGEPGENAVALGKILVIADTDGGGDDETIEQPLAASKGGILNLHFSHSGRLRLTLVDVDRKEDEPRLYLFHEGHLIERVEAKSLGNNSAQTLDLSKYGDIDEVRIYLNGTTGIGGIRLDVPQVAAAGKTWSGVKELFR